MSFDGVVMRSIVKELKEKLLGARLNKIYQPEEDELSMVFYNKGSNYRLLVSANSNNPRIHLSDYSKENPKEAPMFCMLLRKHLLGGRVLNIKQFDIDRIIFIDISSLDELGQASEMRLSIEIMGRHSNIILVDKEEGKILDSIIRVSQDMSRIRQVLPGLSYTTPPSQNKSNPLQSSKEEFYSLIENSKDSLPIFKFFYLNYTGLSPMASKEICYNGKINKNKRLSHIKDEELENLYRSFKNFTEKICKNQFNPLYITDDSDKIIAFYCIQLNQYEESRKHPIDSISQVLDTVYKNRNISNQLNQKTQNIRRTIQTKLDRTLNKLSKQEDELSSSKDRDRFKIFADIISANIYQIPKGVENIKLENFYDENLSLINIPLDKKLSPPQNAERYYRRYSKLKKAESLLQKKIPETRSEVSYLEHVLVSLDNINTLKELEEIKEELIIEGYIRDKNKSKRKKSRKNKLAAPHHYLSQDKFNIYVGKNNRQNEYLTLRFANKEDIWLHVQNMPGSHVIIRRNNQEVPSRTLEEAAILAAYYSKGKYSSNVPVDFTEIKDVRKIPRGKPGMVNYKNHKTIYITPSKKEVNKIQKIDN